MVRLLYTQEALRDLAALFTYIAETNGDSRRAHAFIELIDERCSRLEAFPTMGRLRPDFAPSVRSLPIKPVVAFYRYRAEDGTVEVLRIVDGRRDLGTIFLEGL